MVYSCARCESRCAGCTVRRIYKRIIVNTVIKLTVSVQSMIRNHLMLCHKFQYIFSTDYVLHILLSKLLEKVLIFQVHSSACVKEGVDVCEWLPVSVLLKQGCVMSQWLLLHVFVDGVVSTARLGCLNWGAWCEFRKNEINQLLFADETAPVADSEEKLYRLVSKFGRVCERRKFRVIIYKSTGMMSSTNRYGSDMNARLNGEPKEEWIVLSTWERKWLRMEMFYTLWNLMGVMIKIGRHELECWWIGDLA